jgi:environmental stress-induced protein Ves
MDWTHLKPADSRRVPWKNGAGTTLELAVEPPGATFETGFAWRLSTAEVAVPSPFSAFPGLQRTLLLLTGEGLRVDFGERGVVDLQESLVPLVFSGGWPATATLIGSPCTDLNLMVDPTRCSAQLRILQLQRPCLLNPQAPTALLFVARGTVYVPAGDLHLGPRHTLRVDGAAPSIQLVPGYGGAALVFVEIRTA